MSTEYDLYQNPALNAVVQAKVARSLQRVTKLCWKLCSSEKEVPPDCPSNCVKSYLQTVDLVVETLDSMTSEEQGK